MTEPQDTWDPPQDTGAPDSVETDPGALNSAEDLDEDRLQADPLEEGMDPPEHWSEADKYGTTPWEEAHDRPLGERLAEEQPDTEPAPPDENGPAESDAVDIPDEAPKRYEEELGTSSDVAGGSIAQGMRSPEPPD
ncbi:hypothetical protein [Nocardia blacklockiae]|uniref:hypothetical protein n=1 Tax=Nocardia blacklockiae TaxID=480036 RepID=UPI001895616C|nr:hypothetical protein [Nocardia blacklockiae]MBF6175585.1 hypothetical protein [Nocardia blacklockiae]